MRFVDLHDALPSVCPVIALTTTANGCAVTYAPNATDDQVAAAKALIAGCTADAPPPRTATGRQLRYALNAIGWRAAWDKAASGQIAAGKPDDFDYWETLGSGDCAPETNPKLSRIAAACQPPVDLKALYGAALG